MEKLITIFKKNWMYISFSYFLFTIQSIFMIIYPKVLGDFIDKLIEKDYSHVVYMLLTFFGLIFFGFVSRIYDTIIFSRIYRRFASVETNRQLNNGVETSKINGRLSLMHGIVSFFEHDAIVVLNAVYGIIGSVYFIAMIDYTMVPYLIFSMGLTIYVTNKFSPEITNLTQKNNDIAEEQTDVVTERKISLLNNLLRKKQKLSIKFSNLTAKYHALIQIIAYGTVTFLITYYVLFNDVTVGSVFSTYRYLFDFCIAVSNIPMLIWSFVNIKDVIKRLENEK
jgi:hypothetical protein